MLTNDVVNFEQPAPVICANYRTSIITSFGIHYSLGQKKIIIRFSSTFLKKQMREAGFLF